MRLNSKMSDTKQVRVDNWGVFFLQRLQTFFSKTDYCDMTLQFEGNVQLKVHRLVMNACTEYFRFLEHTCMVEDNVIMMPADLQADVIVPIVNFMYTGMLEFQLSIFDKLYKTAELMNISILTKLLDAQKQSVSSHSVVKSIKKKHIDTPIPSGKRIVSKSDLPTTLPGRKLPIWKRKSIPSSSSASQSYSHGVSNLCFTEPKWIPTTADPLSVPDNTPKPTRFEWPEDEELPSLNLMDSSFEDISYTSKPLLTQEEEIRASTSFDDLKHLPNRNMSATNKKQTTTNLDMEEMKNYIKEQKIRSDLSCNDDENIDNDPDYVPNEYNKRKLIEKYKNLSTKKIKIDEQDNKTTMISISTDGKAQGELNHNKIVSEILKKYPQLVKKNKNIRLKIMSKNKTTSEQIIKIDSPVKTPKTKIQMRLSHNSDMKSDKSSKNQHDADEDKSPWICTRCSTEDEPMEFVLYYLYRKHMTDVHNEKFDAKLCKHCGHKCNKHSILIHHLYTKHGINPSQSYNFPKCNQCPFVALTNNILSKHKLRHNKNEIQCIVCKLAFTTASHFSTHMQITGHNTGRPIKSNYDCQYCTKRLTSVVNLFSHVKSEHRNEAIRDGIVSIEENEYDDEDEEEEEDDEEDNSKDEYILPEIVTDQSTITKKVNILSNVKVSRNDTVNLPLEPSSEAEALSNVASGIATSLGLVDIVVLNDNQQLFLQSNQQNFVNQQSDQPEFILPELTGNENFTAVTTTSSTTRQTDGINPILTGNDIASTDELVMVLTDHDYGDNQEEEINNDSNIVVLYSHPVDGQQDQFITTSQSNIMVNSQTGLIEIRNGAITTTTQSNDTITSESIEMIQREIDGHSDLKQENSFDDDKKPNLENGNQTTEKSDDLTEHEQMELESFCAEQSTDDQPIDGPAETNDNENTEEPAENTSMEIDGNDNEKDNVNDNENDNVNANDNGNDNVNDNGNDNVNDNGNDNVNDIENDNVNNDNENVNGENRTETSMEIEEPEDVEMAENDKTEETKAEVNVEETEKNKEIETDKPAEEEKGVEESEREVTEIEGNEVIEKKGDNENEETLKQFTDESQSSQESIKNENDEDEEEDKSKLNHSMKIAILDDWEDTDSQQSENKNNTKAAEETVNKLMDDWEDEEDEDGKKHNDD